MYTYFCLTSRNSDLVLWLLYVYFPPPPVKLSMFIQTYQPIRIGYRGRPIRIGCQMGVGGGGGGVACLYRPTHPIRIGYRGIHQYKSGDSRGLFLITGGKSGDIFKTIKTAVSCSNVRNPIHELNCTQLKRVNKEVRSLKVCG